jgi:hypothetical protein
MLTGQSICALSSAFEGATDRFGLHDPRHPAFFRTLAH